MSGHVPYNFSVGDLTNKQMICSCMQVCFQFGKQVLGTMGNVLRI
jgi:hypothetical protein